MFIAHLVFGFFILVAVLALLRVYAAAHPAKLATAVRRTAFGSAMLGLALLALRIPFGSVLLGIAGLLPMLLRWSALWPQADVFGRRSQGGTSQIETKYLRMVLDHDSGALDGLVLAGRHRDRRLAELTLDQLLDVRTECLADDPDGVPLIEAYVDRIHGTAWRSADAAGAGAEDASSARPSQTMTRVEAYEVLGLEPGAAEAEIRAAHHRLMMKIHPDQGGSNYLAAKINQAKDLLLGT
jgi:DnaJ domain